MPIIARRAFIMRPPIHYHQQTGTFQEAVEAITGALTSRGYAFDAVLMTGASATSFRGVTANGSREVIYRVQAMSPLLSLIIGELQKELVKCKYRAFLTLSEK